jgi:hypothetical protein
MFLEKPMAREIVACGVCQGTGLDSRYSKAKCPYCGQSLTIKNITNPSLNSDENGEIRFVFRCPNPTCGIKIVLEKTEVEKNKCRSCNGVGVTHFPSR